jgi:hypothetical protein
MEQDEEAARLAEFERKARRRAKLEDVESRYRHAKREGNGLEAKRLRRQISKLNGLLVGTLLLTVQTTVLGTRLTDAERAQVVAARHRPEPDPRKVPP